MNYQEFTDAQWHGFIKMDEEYRDGWENVDLLKHIKKQIKSPDSTYGHNMTVRETIRRLLDFNLDHLVVLEVGGDGAVHNEFLKTIKGREPGQSENPTLSSEWP